MAKEKEDVPLFADGFGYLLTNEDSITHLNEKLKAKNVNLIVDERRFRPNICVKGNKNIMYSEFSIFWNDDLGENFVRIFRVKDHHPQRVELVYN